MQENTLILGSLCLLFVVGFSMFLYALIGVLKPAISHSRLHSVKPPPSTSSPSVARTTPLDEKKNDSCSSDPLEEAKIYVAYGREAQAEEILSIAQKKGMLSEEGRNLLSALEFQRMMEIDSSEDESRQCANFENRDDETTNSSETNTEALHSQWNIDMQAALEARRAADEKIEQLMRTRFF